MLRIAEETLLLILDDDAGDVASYLTPRSLDSVLAGAMLMDLALEDRIDTDLERLMLVDSTPFDDDFLDPVLAEIATETGSHSIDYWVERTAKQGDGIRRRALARLVERGILESDDQAFFFLSHRVSRSKRYPVIDGTITEEVKFRIMRLLFSDDIPTPRDVVIVTLAAAAGVFRNLLSREELAEAKPRIDLISRLDLIGQSVARAVARQPMPPLHGAPPAARPAEEIPKVSGWPLVGSALDMAGDLRSFLARGYRDLGPIFRIRALNRRYIALVGPEANLFVQKRGRLILRSYELWRDFNNAFRAKNSLANMDGAPHVRMRKVHTAAFSRRFIGDRVDKVVDITRGIVADWPRDRPIVAHYAMQKLIAEQIAVLTTGVSIRDHADDLITTLDGLLKVHVMRQHPRVVLRLPRLARARKRMKELERSVLAHHADGGHGARTRDLIDDLLDLHRSDPQFFPETDLRLAVLGPFFAGIETAASTSAFMLYALLKHPELLARMTAEADHFFGRDTLTDRGLLACDVTRRIVLETLRMYPVIPGQPRTVTNTFEFAGYTVPAGANVIIGNTVPHHLPECFPEPERFDIERYTPERAEHRQPGAFVPFGLGTHRCLGSGFAETQIALTLLTIVRDVEVAMSPPGYRLKTKHTPTPHPGRSFRFRVTNREAAPEGPSGR